MMRGQGDSKVSQPVSDDCLLSKESVNERMNTNDEWQRARWMQGESKVNDEWVSSRQFQLNSSPSTALLRTKACECSEWVGDAMSDEWRRWGRQTDRQAGRRAWADNPQNFANTSTHRPHTHTPLPKKHKKTHIYRVVGWVIRGEVSHSHFTLTRAESGPLQTLWCFPREYQAQVNNPIFSRFSGDFSWFSDDFLQATERSW